MPPPVSTPSTRTAPAIQLRVEYALLLTCIYVVGTANVPFWGVALGSRLPWEPAALAWLLALAAILVALHFLLLAPLVWRWTGKPLLGAFLLLSAGAAWFEQRYGVLLDRAMLRNVLHTETQEAAELLSPGLVVHLALFGVLPALLVTLLPLRRDPARAALRRRLASMALALAVLLGAGLAVSSDLAALLRNHREARFLVTPANVLIGVGRVLLDDAAARTAVREPIAPDARRAQAAAAARPLVAVVVVGETVRWANWGLGGYQRQTTPGLVARGAVELGPALACGTSTEISVPCLFSDLDRAHFDLAAARRRESALHLLERVGVHTVWRDNQTGCKGVCDGLASERIAAGDDPALCSDAGCLDGALLHDLEGLLASTPRDLVLVLHPIGNHGPAYFRRYPTTFEHYRPACGSNELGDCTRDSIVNAYDNAVRYTDQVLSDLIDRLQRQRSHDAVLLYVSDHGESLGERGLWLHGVPNFLAPEVQTRVPFTLWLGDGFQARSGIEPRCLAERLAGTLSHDNLFHSLLGLFEVQTRLYQPSLDLFRACRSAVADSGHVAARQA